MLYGVSPDISILLLYTFYQPVFYATHNQSYPSSSEERAARWVGFGEHVGDALTHKLLDDDTKKILYRSAVRPSDSAHPNKRLVSDGGESSQTPKPIVFVRSRQDNSQSATKPMAEYNPDDLIGRTFLLPKTEQGERLRDTIKRKVIETSKLLDDQHDNAIDKINFHLDVGQGRAEAIMSYVQILDHLDQQEQQEDLYKFRAITGHQGPLSPQDENYKGSKYNVMVEWETGEISDEPLSLIAADDPVTCAEYAKKHDDELDNSELASDDLITKFMCMVGQLQWAVTLGRYDILAHVMSMSRFRLAPKVGHIERMKRIYGYLSRTKHYALRFRTAEPNYMHLPDLEFDWTGIYGGVLEEIPKDAPEPLGKSVTTTTFLDANLLHDLITGRSVTSVLHFFNLTPGDWYSKRQATVENATYGSEFVAAKTATEQIIDIRQTLRYLGVPIKSKAYMFGDNKSVVTSSTVPF